MNMISKLQQCELIIANELKRICEENNIQFFLVAGSMLGAVRHKGFIPWDDDMDFGMTRENYEKFLSVCATSLNSEFELLNWDINEDFPFSYCKLCLKGTCVKESFSSQKVNTGIFIDIFPFDNVPDSFWGMITQCLSVYLFRRMLWLKKKYGKDIKNNGVLSKFKYYVAFYFASFFNSEFLKKCLDNALKKHNNTSSAYLFMDSQYSYSRNIIKKEWLQRMGEYIFENNSFPGFVDYDQYLTHLYKNYNELPKEEDRTNHNILFVDFGIY